MPEALCLNGVKASILNMLHARNIYAQKKHLFCNENFKAFTISILDNDELIFLIKILSLTY